MRNFNFRPPHPIRRQVAYLLDPHYGPVKDNRGTRGNVVLGPDYDHTDRCNGGFSSGTLARFKLNTPWVAGHIINQDMGGAAIPDNLVPLTGQANREHSTCENYVKKMIPILRRLSDADVAYYYGVDYSVTVPNTTFYSGAYKVSEPYCHAPSHILVTVKLVRIEKIKIDNCGKSPANLKVVPTKINAEINDEFRKCSIPNTPFCARIDNTEWGAEISRVKTECLKIVPL